MTGTYRRLRRDDGTRRSDSVFGGSGTVAIQLAKRLGAHVTGVDNAAKQDSIRSLGADDVIAHQPRAAEGVRTPCCWQDHLHYPVSMVERRVKAAATAAS